MFSTQSFTAAPHSSTSPKPPKSPQPRPAHSSEHSNTLWGHMARESGTTPLQRQVDAGVTVEPPSDAAVKPAGDASVGVSAGTPPPIPATAPAPTGPNACPTAKEEAEKNLFSWKPLHINRYIPSTTFGMFDASYYPFISYMPVRVKLHLNFVNSPPDLWTLIWEAATGQNIARYYWTPAEESSFQTQFQSRVMARWSMQHKFISTKPCWDFSAHPVVYPLFVKATENPHFNVTTHKSPGPGIDYKSSVDNVPIGATPSYTGTANLWQSDVRTDPDFNSSDVATSERRRIEAAISSSDVSNVLFEQNKDLIRPAQKSALQRFAHIIKQKSPSDPLIPLSLAGFASSEGRRSRNEDLSLDRAMAVEDLLRAQGVKQPLFSIGFGPTGAPNDATNRKVEIEADKTFEAGYSSNRYSVGEHEFGHMLGLDDEYVDNITKGRIASAFKALGLSSLYSGDLQSDIRNGQTQRDYAKLIRKANVPMPSGGFGVDTSSVMAAGIDVLPRHYVTMWEALGKMTTPHIKSNEWKIG